MSKGHEMSTAPNSNPDRSQSKNNPGGKRNGPKTGKYSRGRPYEKKNRPGWLVAMAGKVLSGIVPGTRDTRVSTILVAILKSEDLSHWGQVKHFQKIPNTRNGAGFTVSAPHGYQPQVCGIDTIVQSIRLACDDAIHSDMGSDSGRSQSKDRLVATHQVRQDMCETLPDCPYCTARYAPQSSPPEITTTATPARDGWDAATSSGCVIADSMTVAKRTAMPSRMHANH